MVRLTIPLTKKIKWNAGYRYHDYAEQFGLYGLLQNYHAHGVYQRAVSGQDLRVPKP